MKIVEYVDHFNYGFGFSLLNQVIGTSRRSPAYGLDVGLIATMYFEDSWLNRVDTGFSIINAISTSLPAWTYNSTVGQSKAQTIERQLFAGSKFSLIDYSTEIHHMKFD